MQEFDPRHPPVRYAPRLLLCAAGFAALALGWRLTVKESVRPGEHMPERMAMQTSTPSPGNPQTGIERLEQVAMKVLPGETMKQSLLRLGLAPAEAAEAVHLLGSAYDTVNIKAGLVFQAAVARPLDHRGPVRLIGLQLRTGPATAISLSRTFDGALRLRQTEEKTREETTVAEGRMADSLYGSAIAAGATPELTAQVVKLFSHKLDFSRDIHPDDEFKLVFDREVTDSGRTIETGDLLYAEIGARGQTTRFYRFQAPGGSEAQYFDEAGKNIRGFLLRTPLDGARITSGFGMRLHPILGYTRMHTGIDFAAPVGTPVFAAGDGVVKEARWAGGYGRWLEIQHNSEWATGYGHLSGWAVRQGEHVHQGEVVAYVGSTGESTGPHLHYEVIHDGQKINPAGATVPQGTILGGRELVAFKAVKARIDALLKHPDQDDGVRLAGEATSAKAAAAAWIRTPGRPAADATVLRVAER
ncbi:MAG TPA: M23 family metallopeptidase [Caulobacteraceae bacterium]|nr:M23 family metallopeptidase [Caulobacteraceae bacterium]